MSRLFYLSNRDLLADHAQKRRDGLSAPGPHFHASLLISGCARFSCLAFKRAIGDDWVSAEESCNAFEEACHGNSDYEQDTRGPDLSTVDESWRCRLWFITSAFPVQQKWQTKWELIARNLSCSFSFPCVVLGTKPRVVFTSLEIVNVLFTGFWGWAFIPLCGERSGYEEFVRISSPNVLSFLWIGQRNIYQIIS